MGEFELPDQGENQLDQLSDKSDLQLEVSQKVELNSMIDEEDEKVLEIEFGCSQQIKVRESSLGRPINKTDDVLDEEDEIKNTRV